MRIEVPLGFSKEELGAFRRVAEREQPALVPLIDAYINIAHKSILNLKSKKPIVRQRKYSVRAADFFSLLRSRKLFPRNLDLAVFATRALATLELHSGGALKKVRKLTKISLRAPTENSVAQAMSSRREIGGDFDVTKFLNIPNANEARATAAYDAADFETSATECWKWLEDENFSVRAALTGAFVNSCLLSNYEKALAFVEQGLQANPSEPMLLNNKILSLAYLGRPTEAAVLLPQLETYEHDKRMKPFVEAARGLVAFRLGDYMRGRDHYERAVMECAQSEKGSLGVNAWIYWLEQELHAGTTDQEVAKTIVARLDDYYSRKENGGGKSFVWAARKKNILHLIDENAKRAFLRGAVKAVKNLMVDFPLLTR